MARYRKILVAVDGSDASLHALRETFKLAACEKCWITVTSVVPPYEGELELVGVGNIRVALRQPCEKALADAAELAKAHGALIKTVCEEGEPHERIVDLAEAENCDLIITARTGKGSVKRALVGSVAARVIGYSHIDVLVVPTQAEVGWKSILLATDGSKYSAAAVARAIDFAASYGGSLKALQVIDVPAEFYAETRTPIDEMIQKAKVNVQRIRQDAATAGVNAEAMVREGDSAEVIIKLAAEEEIQTVVIGSHGRTGLRRLLMGSVAEKVVGNAPCPVLVVKP
jgi:nucleotide-binding universal stress UspA family protein